MDVVSLLAIAVQEQVPFTPAAGAGSDGRMWLWIALGVGALALVAALMLTRTVVAADTGTADMQVISNAIREGAEAFLTKAVPDDRRDCAGSCAVCSLLGTTCRSERPHML